MHVICTLIVVMLAGAAGQPQVRISGIVRDLQGGALQGATLTVTTRGVTRGETVTDENGAFEIGGLLAGTYSVTATLVGFRPETKDVLLTEASAGPLEFALRPGVLNEVLWVLPEPREAHRRAHAIAHVRIDATLPPAPCGDASIVSASHRAAVVTVWISTAPTLRLGCTPSPPIQRTWPSAPRRRAKARRPREARPMHFSAAAPCQASRDRGR